MTEKLFQFIWQFQYFNQQELQTVHGELLQIINQGKLNSNQGPDFLDAAVKIGNITFAGHIELHILSSDWNKHNHSSDKNYSNIILHVVWQHDADVQDQHQTIIPTLVLQDRVAKILLQRFELLMNDQSVIHCKNYLPALSDIGWLSWKERLAVERLEMKAKKVLTYYDEANHHWEETFWWMMAYNFGIKVNAALFEAVARSIPINILAKHKNQIHQLEALLFGQANLLNDDFEEDYPKLLQREYRFLQKKYNLPKVNVAVHFLRMRPANFPTIRLAQLAMFIHQSNHLFSKIKEMNELKQVKQLFDITCNDYWHYHFVFDDAAAYQPKHIGTQMVNNILINTVVPVLFAYGLFNNEQLSKDKAIRWLAEIAAEDNTITNAWKKQGIINSNALDSQALIHLANHYCSQKFCLECAVGNKLLKTTNEN